MRFFITVMWLSLLVTNANASYGPCPFTALIDQGETLIMCPESSEFLSVNLNFDTYQWFRQSALTQEIESIQGETSSFIEISASTAAFYFYWCEVSLNGCIDISNQIFIDSYVFVPTTIQSVTNSICEGESTTFEIIGTVGSYEWYRDGSPLGIDSPTLEVTQSGTYTASVFPILCPQYEINSGIGPELIVHPTPIPVIYFNSATNEVCIESMMPNIEWYYENNPIIGANAPCVTFIGNGSYVAAVLDEFGCRGESDALVVTNIHENYLPATAYPNPFVDVLNVQWHGQQTMRIVDAYGRQVVEKQFIEGIPNDVSFLPSGTYFLHVGDQIIKLVKVQQ